MTKEEKHLWYDFLKHLPFTVKRQEICGNYIADFYIPSYHIIIELDGSQHNTPKNKEKDMNRDLFLISRDYKVLRYRNIDINCNFESVCYDIGYHMGLTKEELCKQLKGNQYDSMN